MSSERIASIEAPDYKLIAEFRDLAKSICGVHEEANLEYDPQHRLLLAVGQGLDESQDGESYDMSTHEYFTDRRGITHDFRIDYISARSGLIEKLYDERLKYAEEPDPVAVIDTIEDELHTQQLVDALVDSVFVRSSSFMDAFEIIARRKRYTNDPNGNKITRPEINALLERVRRAVQ